jgi:hypothetical protein
MGTKERKPEDVQNYIDIYETLRKAVPDGRTCWRYCEPQSSCWLIALHRLT